MRKRDISLRAAMVISMIALFAAPSSAADFDGDGVADEVDNCPTVSNVEQVDADGDSAGNACDADYNNDGAITAADGEIILAAMGTAENDDLYNPIVDHDGDGQILMSDYEVFLNSYPGE